MYEQAIPIGRTGSEIPEVPKSVDIQAVNNGFIIEFRGGQSYWNRKIASSIDEAITLAKTYFEDKE